MGTLQWPLKSTLCFLRSDHSWCGFHQDKAFPLETENDEDGSGNEEDSYAKAQASCCHLPIVVGPCEAYGARWGFDNKKETCVEFVYGGCGGNNSKEDCEKACSESN